MLHFLGWESQAPAPAPVHNTDFFTELHEFFNKVVINFDNETGEEAPTLEAYQSRIISSLSVYMSYPTLKQWAARAKIGPEGERDPVIALKCIFNPDTQKAFESISNPKRYNPEHPRNYLETKLLMNAHITEFPEGINSLASIYYQIADSPKHFTFKFIFPLYAEYSPSHVQHTVETKILIPLWIKFLRECIDFRLMFSFLPPQAHAKLDTFVGSSEEYPDFTLESMISHMNSLLQNSVGGKRKRSTRIRHSRRRIRHSRRRIRNRHNKSTRKYISNT